MRAFHCPRPSISGSEWLFRDDAPAPNQSVSRAHAHLEFDSENVAFRLYDDRSAHGTTVVRDGTVIPVPPGPSKGVALRDGDEIVLGQARLRFEIMANP